MRIKIIILLAGLSILFGNLISVRFNALGTKITIPSNCTKENPGNPADNNPDKSCSQGNSCTGCKLSFTGITEELSANDHPASHTAEHRERIAENYTDEYCRSVWQPPDPQYIFYYLFNLL